MRITLDAASKGAALPPVSLAFETGAVTVVGVETEQRPTVLGLVASGRMRPESGTVHLDGAVSYRAMRTAIALVDAPGVSDPSPAVTLAGVTAEELMFAGQPASPWEVMRVLKGFGAEDYARVDVSDVPPVIRLRVLAELALLRDGVRGLVLVSPDRHGGDPADWEALAHELAARDLAILVIVGRARATSTSPVPTGTAVAARTAAAPEESTRP
jgi:hypothetical protein